MSSTFASQVGSTFANPDNKNLQFWPCLNQIDFRKQGPSNIEGFIWLTSPSHHSNPSIHQSQWYYKTFYNRITSVGLNPRSTALVTNGFKVMANSFKSNRSLNNKSLFANHQPHTTLKTHLTRQMTLVNLHRELWYYKTFYNRITSVGLNHGLWALRDQWNLEWWEGLLIYKLMVLNEPLPLRGFCFQHIYFDKSLVLTFDWRQVMAFASSCHQPNPQWSGNNLYQALSLQHDKCCLTHISFDKSLVSFKEVVKKRQTSS